MIWQRIWNELHKIPWPALVWLAATAFIVFISWQFTKHYYTKAWLRYAPEKVRDVVLEMRRQLADEQRERRRLEAEVAELCGMVEGAKARLTRPRQLELIEGTKRKA